MQLSTGLVRGPLLLRDACGHLLSHSCCMVLHAGQMCLAGTLKGHLGPAAHAACLAAAAAHQSLYTPGPCAAMLKWASEVMLCCDQICSPDGLCNCRHVLTEAHG